MVMGVLVSTQHTVGQVDLPDLHTMGVAESESPKNNREVTMRIRTIVVAACSAVLVALLGVGATEASAAPITCPDGQTATQTSPGTWDCVNNGGNTSNAEDPKNPNVGKGFF